MRCWKGRRRIYLPSDLLDWQFVISTASWLFPGFYIGLTQTRHMLCITHPQRSTCCGFRPVLRKSYYSLAHFFGDKEAHVSVAVPSRLMRVFHDEQGL